MICFAGLLILVTCASCKADTAETYKVKDYLDDLSYISGIGISDDIDENLEDLKEWEIIDEEDEKEYDKALNYDYLSKTVKGLLDDESLDLNDYIPEEYKKKKYISEEEANEVIHKAVDHINNKTFEPDITAMYVKDPKSELDELETGDLLLKDGLYFIITGADEDHYNYREAEFEEVFSYLDISDTYEVDFSQAEVVSYGEEENTAYQNEKFTLLSTNNHVFNTDGFRISYTLNRAGIDVHISKDINGMNVYGDLSINNIKPSFKWLYKEDDLKNCYFNVKFNSTEKIGCSTGKYGNYHLKFSKLDSSTFKSLVKSMIEPAKDEVEASLRICSIRTPIPEIPTAYLDLDVLIKLYTSGKAEIDLYNSHSLGFETKDGHIRFINDNTHDYDTILQGSAKAAAGINIGLEAATFKLADVELDGGLKGVLKATMHLYDDEGNLSSEKTNIAYSTLEEVSKGNPDVKICGDVSFYWMMDLIINTSKTKMAKLGLSKTLHILDDDNQVFGNLHHIEDGHFVKSCTRKDRKGIKTMEEVVSNRIVLDSYAEVLKLNESYEIIIKALPEGYKLSDLVYSSENAAIASVSGGSIKALSPGSAKIRVSTSDNKYEAYVNILVSTG